MNSTELLFEMLNCFSLSRPPFQCWFISFEIIFLFLNFCQEWFIYMATVSKKIVPTTESFSSHWLHLSSKWGHSFSRRTTKQTWIGEFNVVAVFSECNMIWQKTEHYIIFCISVGCKWIMPTWQPLVFDRMTHVHHHHHHHHFHGNFFKQTWFESQQQWTNYEADCLL